ncbi:MAG: hypothetical protein OXF73_10800 [Gammaproteobacteria bacterium]|nr:hypothetical protein [Gammaproteobacteria bacterium]MCY4227251.1 hypothetical protein [Gammaproteobacteria bacterium]
MANTTLRHPVTLMTIPVYPKSRSTRDIHDRLCQKNPDFAVDIHSIQRSLDELSRQFPITVDRKVVDSTGAGRIRIRGCRYQQ